MSSQIRKDLINQLLISKKKSGKSFAAIAKMVNKNKVSFKLIFEF